jgi:O-phosphoseryl-tRNA(Cys) synthetase
MNIFSQFHSTQHDNELSQQLVVRNMKNSDNKSDVHYLLKNIELDINNKDVEIFVLQEERKKHILGVGCVLFKLTNKHRIGVIGEIYNIHTHKSVNIEDRNKFIEEIANFAIDSGCYACTLKNSYLDCIRCKTN